jgi:hypothetical protein
LLLVDSKYKATAFRQIQALDGVFERGDDVISPSTLITSAQSDNY